MVQIIHYPASMIHRTRGVALLMVLIIVMAITIIATGFVARTDVELACGENMLMQAQMNQLAESALEHARGLLLRPQDASTSFWTGDSGLQLLSGSPDYYDVSVTPNTSDATDYCSYNVVCEAYRQRNGQKVGRYGLFAVVRLDPAIGLWTQTDATLRPNWTLRGDVRTQGNLINQAAAASLDGDIFATQLTGACLGQTRTYADVSLDWPPVTSTYANLKCLTPGALADTLTTSLSGSPIIRRRIGDLSLGGNVAVTGMLLVTGNLTVTGSGSRITAAKNFPALYVGGDLVLEDANDFTVEGLAVIGGSLRLRASAGNVKFVGGLCLGGTISETTPDASGYGNQARLVGNPTWTAGQWSGALDLSALDGVPDYVQTSDSSSLLQLGSQYTLSLWLKAAATQNDNAGVMVRCSPDGALTHWGLQFNATTPKLLVVRHLNDTGNAWSTGITLDEIGDVWHHVAVVWSGTAMTSYLDGAQRASGPWAYALGNGNGHLNLGSQGTVSASTLYAGAIDDVRVYDHAWTAAEIAVIYTGGSVANLIGQWRLNGPGSSVTILTDPVRASIAAWPNGLNYPAVYWSPASDAFFRSITRHLP